jgi:hypothetical protein
MGARGVKLLTTAERPGCEADKVERMTGRATTEVRVGHWPRTRRAATAVVMS